MSDHNSDRARDIMEVATALFAQRGYDGVSVRDICSRLEVNCSVISYYFGGKKGLYQKILEAQFEAYEEALNAIMSDNPDPREELEALCDRLAGIHAQCPHLSAISSRESCNPSPEYQEALIRHETKYQGGHLANLIRSGQREGLFNPDLDPVYLARVLSLVFNSQVIARATFGFLHPAMNFAEAEYFATVKSVLLEGLLRPPADSHESGGQRAPARRRPATKGIS